MIGKIIGGIVGEKIAQKHGNGLKGAALGAIAPALARRVFSPLGLIVAGGYVAKKLWDRKRRAQSA
jgi:hypothetical protein